METNIFTEKMLEYLRKSSVSFNERLNLIHVKESERPGSKSIKVDYSLTRRVNSTNEGEMKDLAFDQTKSTLTKRFEEYLWSPEGPFSKLFGNLKEKDQVKEYNNIDDLKSHLEDHFQKTSRLKEMILFINYNLFNELIEKQPNLLEERYSMENPDLIEDFYIEGSNVKVIVTEGLADRDYSLLIPSGNQIYLTLEIYLSLGIKYTPEHSIVSELVILDDLQKVKSLQDVYMFKDSRK